MSIPKLDGLLGRQYESACYNMFHTEFCVCIRHHIFFDPYYSTKCYILKRLYLWSQRPVSEPSSSGIP